MNCRIKLDADSGIQTTLDIQYMQIKRIQTKRRLGYSSYTWHIRHSLHPLSAANKQVPRNDLNTGEDKFSSFEYTAAQTVEESGIIVFNVMP